MAAFIVTAEVEARDAYVSAFFENSVLSLGSCLDQLFVTKDFLLPKRSHNVLMDVGEQLKVLMTILAFYNFFQLFITARIALLSEFGYFVG